MYYIILYNIIFTKKKKKKKKKKNKIKRLLIHGLDYKIIWGIVHFMI